MHQLAESNRIEYKQELTDDLEKEVVAFLNYRDGGVIYIGIDKTNVVVGVAECDELQLKVKNRIRDKISPSTMGLFDVVVEQVEGKELIKITIASGLEKPYHLRRKGMTEQGCFIRVGSASEPMPQRMIEDLFSRRVRNSIGTIKSRNQDLSFEQLKIESRTFAKITYEKRLERKLLNQEALHEAVINAIIHNA